MTKIPPPMIALDISKSATGWAVGQPGGKPLAFGTIRPEVAGKRGHASQLLFLADAVVGIAKLHGCTMAVAEELNVRQNMNTVRILSQVVGGCIVQLKEKAGLDLQFINISKARGAAGVDLGWHGAKKGPDPKARAAENLKLRGIKVNSLDEVDACIILLATGTILKTQALAELAKVKGKISELCAASPQI